MATKIPHRIAWSPYAPTRDVGLGAIRRIMNVNRAVRNARDIGMAMDTPGSGARSVAF